MSGGDGPGVSGKVAADGIAEHGKAAGTGGLTSGCVIVGNSVDFLVVAARSGGLGWAAFWVWGCWYGDGRNLDDELVLGALPRAGLLGVPGVRTVLGVCCLRERGVLVVEDEEDD